MSGPAGVPEGLIAASRGEGRPRPSRPAFSSRWPRPALLAPTLALVLALAVLASAAPAPAGATERDLRTHPAEWTLVGAPEQGSGMAFAIWRTGTARRLVTFPSWAVPSLPGGGVDVRMRSPVGQATDHVFVATGDFSGTGRLGVALGAPKDRIAFDGCTHGAVHLILDPSPARGGLLQPPDWTLRGSNAAGLGMHAVGGDWSGDGIDDLIAAEWSVEVACGLPPAYFYGIASPFPPGGVVDLAVDAPTFWSCELLHGISWGRDRLALGDVLGDGRIDLVVANSEGAMVFAGADLSGQLDWSRAVTRITARRDSPGRVLVRDIDGDGLADIVLATGRDDAVDPVPFAVHVVRGRPDLPPAMDVLAGGADLTVRMSGRIGFGETFALGDVTGDGRLDLAVGMPDSAGPAGDRPDAGAVAVVSDIGLLAGDLDLTVTPPAHVVHGVDPGDRLGGDIYGTGAGLLVADVDGDGRDDLSSPGPPAPAAPGTRRRAMSAKFTSSWPCPRAPSTSSTASPIRRC